MRERAGEGGLRLLESFRQRSGYLLKKLGFGTAKLMNLFVDRLRPREPFGGMGLRCSSLLMGQESLDRKSVV
jgi:hypothetical protein